MKWFSCLVALLFGLIVGFLLPRGQNEDAPRLQAGSESVVRESVIQQPGQPSSKASAVAQGSQSSVSDAEGKGLVTAGGEIDTDWLASLEDLSAFDRVGALHERLKNVNIAEFPALMDELAGGSFTSISWQSRSMIAARWAELDRSGLQTYIKTQPIRQRWGLINALYTEWGRNDPDAAIAAAKSLSQNEYQNALGGILSAMAETSPEKAVSILNNEVKLGTSRHWTYNGLYQAWAKHDPEAALASAEALEDPMARSSALVGVLSERIQEDPQWALGWLDAQDQSQIIQQTKGQVLSRLMEEDIDAVLSYVESKDSYGQRKLILDNLHFSNLGWQKDYDTLLGVVDWLGTVAKGQTYNNKVGNLFYALVQSDPERAEAHALGLPPGNLREAAISSVAQALSQSDPKAAFAFIEGLEFEEDRERALQQVSWQLASNHPDLARKLVQESDNPLVQERLSGRLAEQYALQDREGALAWVESLTSDSAKDNGLRSVLKSWVIEDAEAAFGYIATLEKDTQKQNFYQNTLQQYLYEDPESGVQWLTKLDEEGLLGENSSHVYQNAVRTYVSQDPMAASEWVATLEEGDRRDSAVDGLVNAIYRSDPEAGFVWATTISNESQRGSMLQRTVGEWAKKDPSAAYEAVKDARIEAEEKEILFNIIEK